MLLVEENHTGVSTSTYANNKMFSAEAYRPRGRGVRGGSAHNGGGRQEQNQTHGGGAESSGPSRRTTGKGGARPERKIHELLVLWPKGSQGK